ncbi:MAG TPA: hypothetical protein VFV08_09245, partial [Puia sp.]|nr:hypothetical protein [Puia sp.]
LKSIEPLVNLYSLNLVGTRITTAGLLSLKNLKKLKSIYLFQTGVKKQDWPTLQKAFPGVAIDSGGYTVPLFPTDTEVVKPPKLKK